MTETLERAPTPNTLGVIPKLTGCDVELANYIEGRNVPGGTGHEASRLWLREIDGLSTSYYYTGAGYYSPPAGYDAPAVAGSDQTTGGTAVYSNGWNPQDIGRKFLVSNGGCAYIDLNHLELCNPETLSAYDHVAAFRAMLLIAREALCRANEKRLEGHRLQGLANNSDGLGKSYGGHLNVLLSRRAWNDLFHRKLHHLLFLATYHVSSIVFAGQGKVGSENGRPRADYQLSQRADFFECLVGEQTTFDRPIVNSRDEALCGTEGRVWRPSPDDSNGLARLHVICQDTTLAPVASLLKIGVLQAIASCIEAGQVDPRLILDDPVHAIQTFSHDPSLEVRCAMADGTHLTAVEIQLKFLEFVRTFHERGGLERVVPRAAEILDLWEDTLVKLKNHDFPALASRLDWVLKWSLIQHAISQDSSLGWASPEVKMLDHLYSAVDSTEGLFFQMESAGQVEQIVSAASIERFVHEPPEDTRAWTRAMLLRRLQSESIVSIDWDSIRFRATCGYRYPSIHSVSLDNPLRFSRSETDRIFQENETAAEVAEALDEPVALEAPPLTAVPQAVPVTEQKALPGPPLTFQENSSSSIQLIDGKDGQSKPVVSDQKGESHESE